MGGKDLNTCAIICCLQGDLVGSWIRYREILEPGVHVEYGQAKQWLNLMFHVLISVTVFLGKGIFVLKA